MLASLLPLWLYGTSRYDMLASLLPLLLYGASRYDIDMLASHCWLCGYTVLCCVGASDKLAVRSR